MLAQHHSPDAALARQLSPGQQRKRLTARSGYSTAAGTSGSISQPMPSQSGSISDHAATVELASSVSHGNSWNEFQHEFRGRHWGTEKMRAEYWRFQASGKKPK